MLLYRNTIDLCILTLYLAIVLNFFIRSNRFLVDFLTLSRYEIMSSANRLLVSSIPIWMHFISFSCLIVLVRIVLV